MRRQRTHSVGLEPKASDLQCTWQDAMCSASLARVIVELCGSNENSEP